MIAAFFLASSMALTGVPDRPVQKPSLGQLADQERLKQCMAMVNEDPENAYEQAKAWENETHAPEARRCAALAMIGRGEPATGARQLEQLAIAKSAADGASRAEMLVEAGNAWILARAPKEAVADLSAALKLAPDSPDTLIDRARAYAMGLDWRAAEQDLTTALDARPKDSYALALRAETRRRQKVYDLALKDVRAALALDPKNEIAMLVRGEVLDEQNQAKKSPAGGAAAKDSAGH